METVQVTIEIPKELHERILDKARRMQREPSDVMVGSLELMNPAGPVELPFIPSTGKPIDLTNEQLYDLIGLP